MKHIEIEGDRVPALGLGTWMLKGDECRGAVRDALETGYRHIDTASAYGNEEEIGEALRNSGISRDEIFLTTKVWWEDLKEEEAMRSAEESLKNSVRS